MFFSVFLVNVWLIHSSGMEDSNLKRSHVAGGWESIPRLYIKKCVSYWRNPSKNMTMFHISRYEACVDWSTVCIENEVKNPSRGDPLSSLKTLKSKALSLLHDTWKKLQLVHLYDGMQNRKIKEIRRQLILSILSNCCKLLISILRKSFILLSMTLIEEQIVIIFGYLR